MESNAFSNKGKGSRPLQGYPGEESGLRRATEGPQGGNWGGTGEKTLMAKR